ncbi:hypothetical protein FN846DRAFT_87136 [Sphaerosporella brunnea]|uniref:C2H2-type domain-containing protein n=1 Tax=Sphaerosporella brunnea TaxID=1250544 RepID=A0A5J5ETA3_9PEZI|nr:hypothetical protein FN846DRAFT_87136 [Sphaerosporella brunnea]
MNSIEWYPAATEAEEQHLAYQQSDYTDPTAVYFPIDIPHAPVRDLESYFASTAGIGYGQSAPEFLSPFAPYGPSPHLSEPSYHSLPPSPGYPTYCYPYPSDIDIDIGIGMLNFPLPASVPFPCDFPTCNKSFPRLCDLRKHRKRHEKPFPCSLESCEAFFSTEKDRDRHEKSKHRREEHLVCPVCGHRTARRDNLKDHVRRRHGGEGEAERIMGSFVERQGAPVRGF